MDGWTVRRATGKRYGATPPLGRMPYDTALVLSGGGARASYQVGTLAALGEIVPDLRFPIVTGVSAGAINTVCLAANAGSLAESVSSLQANWKRLTSDQVYCVQPLSVVRGGLRLIRDMITGRRTGDPALRGILNMDPLRGFLRNAVDLHGIRANIKSGRLKAAALSATSYTTGWTVTFVECVPGVPMWTRAQRMSVRQEITVDHVIASAAIPIVFPAVHINKEYFGDGSVRQSAPLAPAIHLGARRLLAIGMRAPRPATVPILGDPDYPSSAEVFGLLMNSVFLDTLDADSERLNRVNQILDVLPPTREAPPGLKQVDLLVLRPSRDLGAMAGDRRVRLPRIVSLLVRAMGGRRRGAADFLSYLMFEPSYTGDLMQLGYEDAYTQRPAIETFFEAADR